MNLALFNWIHGFAGRSGFLDRAGIFFADTLIYLLVLGGIWYVLRQAGMRRKIFVTVEILLAVIISRGIITETVRYFYIHPRPFDALGFPPLIPESGNSFPSGHMTALFAMATVLYLLNRKWGIWYMTLSFLVGVGRVYVGVHWPLDILGGILIGIASGWVVHYFARPYWEKLGNAPETIQA